MGCEIFSMWQNLGRTQWEAVIAFAVATRGLTLLPPHPPPCRGAQAELHPRHDRPVPGGHAGPSARPEERHDPHLPRHDGLGAAAQRQLQTGDTVGAPATPPPHTPVLKLPLPLPGGGQADRQAGQPHVGGQRGRDVPRALQQHVSGVEGGGRSRGSGGCEGASGSLALFG